MAVKVPPLLHKMSLASQKAWYKKHGMEMPSAPAAGKSAAQAKKDVGEINKEKAKAERLKTIAAVAKKIIEPSSDRVRMMRKNADMFGGGLGGGLDRNRDIINFVRSGGYIKAGRLGEESVEEAYVKTKEFNKEKLKNYVRGLGTKAVIAGKVPFDQVNSPLRAGRKALKQESATEVNEMSHGKKLAKMIMAKQSKHPIAQQMGEEVKDVADVGEYDYEGDMAKSQLRSILANAKRLHDMLEDKDNLPEWVQSKITLAQDYIMTAADYMDGEMNEEVEQVDEVSQKMVRAYRDKARDDLEDAKDNRAYFKALKDTTSYEDDKIRKRTAGIKLATKKMYGGAKVRMGEEVEQVDEKINLAKAKMGDVVKDFYKSKAPQFKGKSMAKRREMAVAAKLGAEREAGMREEVVTEAEGTVAVTPKEKALAAHHGDKTKITYGDVIKARLKSAAAKKMGK